jgi:uncharacterized protein (TIGR00369 family)
MRKQPNSNFCFICGRRSPIGLKMSFYSIAPGEVTAEHVVPDEYQGYPGMVHGGVTAAMLDETAGRTVLANGNDQFYMTLRLEIKYRKPGPTETMLRIIGRLETMRSRRAIARSEIQLQDGTVLAQARAVLVEVPASLLEAADPAALGWMIQDD